MRFIDIPTDVILCILYHCGTDKHFVAEKLLLTSKTLWHHFKNDHCKKFLVDSFPQRRQCDEAACRRQVAFCSKSNNIESLTCQTHRYEDSIPCVVTSKNIEKTWEILASHGHVNLLKLLSSKGAFADVSTTLRDKAIGNGHLGCARWIVDCGTCALPPSNSILKYFQTSNIAGVKASYMLGLRLCRNDILKSQKTLADEGLHTYLLGYPHSREVLFPGWFDTNWELRMAFYHLEVELVDFLISRGETVDVVCGDMVMIGASETRKRCDQKRRKFFHLFDLLESRGFRPDVVTMFYASTLNCRIGVFEFLLKAFRATAPSRHSITDVLYNCYRWDRVNHFRKILDNFAFTSMDLSSMLEQAICTNAPKIVTFLVDQCGARCKHSVIIPANRNVRTMMLSHLRSLLVAGAKFEDLQEIFIMSLEQGKMYHIGIGLLKSKYADHYYEWLNSEPWRQEAFKRMLYYRL